MTVLKKKTIENEGVSRNTTEVIRDFDNVTEPPPAKKEKNDKMLTVRTTQQKIIEYKVFFAGKNLSVSRGVQIAVDYLMRQVADGKAELKDTGIFTRGN